MLSSEDKLDKWFTNMMEMGLVSTANRWIEMATDQRNRRLTLDLACSIVYIYDWIDAEIANHSRFN